MDISFIETFYWAATLKSVSAAAQRMHIVPQAASSRIRALELELGVGLTDKTARGNFRLTPTGEKFARDAEALLRLWRELRSSYPAQHSIPMSLRIGTIESALSGWIIPWIAHLTRQNPSVTLQITTETSEALGELLEKGRLDIIVSAEGVYQEAVRTSQLPSMPMTFVGHRASHTQDNYTLTELVSGPLMTFQRRSQPYVKLCELLAKHGLDASQVHALSSISAMLQLIRSGFGVAALPRAAIEGLARDQGFIPLPCAAALPELPLYVSWRTDPASDALDTVAQDLIEFVAVRSGGA